MEVGILEKLLKLPTNFEHLLPSPQPQMILFQCEERANLSWVHSICSGPNKCLLGNPTRYCHTPEIYLSKTKPINSLLRSFSYCILFTEWGHCTHSCLSKNWGHCYPCYLNSQSPSLEILIPIPFENSSPLLCPLPLFRLFLFIPCFTSHYIPGIKSYLIYTMTSIIKTFL